MEIKDKKRNKWSFRESEYYIADHVLDNKKLKGFDYHGQIFKHSLSGIFFEEEIRTILINIYEVLICHLVDSVKQIKRNRNYAIDRRDVDFN